MTDWPFPIEQLRKIRFLIGHVDMVNIRLGFQLLETIAEDCPAVVHLMTRDFLEEGEGLPCWERLMNGESPEPLQFFEENGQVCPAGWNKEKAAFSPSDPTKLADYLSENATGL